MNFLRRYVKEVVIGVLILSNLVVWLQVRAQAPSEFLKVYFLDVGQGDAILIDSPTHGRILIDGGPNKKVLTELGKIMPFGDRRIDVVIESHPDKDHIGGLPAVVDRYKVGLFLEPGVESDNDVDDALHTRVEKKSVEHLLARRGMVVDLGDGAKLTILFPNTDVSTWDTNDASVIARLTYGEESFLFTGDAALKTENLLLNMKDGVLRSTVLKAGHHGSRTSSSLYFVQAVAPEYAVISAGKDNTYGHPHKEVLERLASVGTKILGTAEEGTIVFITDGETVEIK